MALSPLVRFAVNWGLHLSPTDASECLRTEKWTPVDTMKCYINMLICWHLELRERRGYIVGLSRALPNNLALRHRYSGSSAPESQHGLHLVTVLARAVRITCWIRIRSRGWWNEPTTRSIWLLVFPSFSQPFKIQIINLGLVYRLEPLPGPKRNWFRLLEPSAWHLCALTNNDSDVLGANVYISSYLTNNETVYTSHSE